MIRSLLAGHVRTAAAAVLADAGQPWPDGLAVQVEQPARPEHGDYATNVAMALARTLRRPPMQIAGAIRDRLGEVPLVARAEIAPPGFLNFFLDWGAWARRGTRYTPPAERAATKIVVEHTSVNPNKAAHIGHLRNACIGDTLARLLRRVGYKVEVHNYIDDLGNQVADTVVGLLHVPVHGDHHRFGDFCWDVYARVNQAYRDDHSLAARRTEVLRALEEGGNNTAWLGRLVAERIVREHLEDMAEFGITYDLLVWEGDIVRQGFWAAAFDLLRRSPLFVKEETGKYAGCWVLKQPAEVGAGSGGPAGTAGAAGAGTGADAGAAQAGAAAADGEAAEAYNPDKVLVRSNGVLTYTAKDIAYHLWKFGLLGRDFRYRQFGRGLWTSAAEGVSRPFGRAHRVVNVIDRRQEYPQSMVRLALETLGFTDAARGLHHVGYGVVSLSPATAARLGVDVSDGRSSYPMSGRQGIGIKITDLLEQMEETIDRERTRKAGASSRAIAAGAVRYFLLRFHLMTEIVFDIEQALDIRGNTGPYVMYAHARAASILRKAGGAPASPPDAFPPELTEPERLLLRQLADWPDTLEQSARDLNPTPITGYAYQLATLFNQFYESTPVLKAEEPERTFRLWLVDASRHILADVLDVLGLPAPTRM
ncbi:arginine--tRNA ligase [Caldinitratiruptor microaerophilus]|uniref:Arginine--tRNA ligase n=1 Tax=Caldinitratiruptor microaerophilus TaxID=671077 RepID=A0AA35CLZ3_9FIRM|nr:arginine--tRNA ligase [Caldinitratiruptor microaerophilus]BDG61652.1 arginyl-tRNA synthetase [Caldinitratiruptor microaerophilus]